MIGLCLEAETNCTYCGQLLAINALTHWIVCTQCLEKNHIDADDWRHILDDLWKEGIHFTEGEGKNITSMGQKTIKMMHGRQTPRFRDTKTDVDIEDVIKNIGAGVIHNPQTQTPFSVRKLPENFKALCPNVEYVLGEDFTQLPGNVEDPTLSMKPQGDLIPFNCPNCAGTLQINGSARLLKCQFCSSEAYIPDEIWQQLHPVKTRSRFYFWFNEKTVQFKWESSCWDMVVDADGIIYLVLEPGSFSESSFWLVALYDDMTLKWKRTDIKFKHIHHGAQAQLFLKKSGELVLFSPDRNAIVLINKEDGTEIKRVGKKSEETEKEDHTMVDFARCISIAPDPEGNFYLWHKRDRVEPGYYELMMADKDGNLFRPWSLEPPKKTFFGSLKKALIGFAEPPYFDKAKNRITRCKDNDVEITIGFDGSIYMKHYKYYAKYDQTGTQIYMNEIEQGYVSHKIVGDAKGNAYYIAGENDKYRLYKVSPDGEEITVIAKHVTEGGECCDETILAISENGNFYCADYSNEFRKFDAEGKLLFASEESLEDEEDAKREIRDMED